MTSAAFIAALKPLLAARTGLAGVGVYLVEPEYMRSPAIVLIRARVPHEIEYVAFGPERTDTVTIPGFVRTHNQDFQPAADQALAIIEEIALQARDAPPQVGEQTQIAKLERLAWTPIISDKGGYAVDAEFDLTYTSDLP